VYAGASGGLPVSVTVIEKLLNERAGSSDA
jgi:hypothetical protein